MIGATVTDQDPGLHQSAHTLLEKEGIALHLRDEALPQWLQTGVIPEQGLEQLLGGRGGQRVEPELRVIRFTAPAVLVLGAVVNQRQHTGGREAVDQRIEHGLRLGVDPVQVFEDQEQGLYLAFAQEDALQRLQGAAPSLQGVQVQEQTVCRQGFEQGEHGRHSILEGFIQRQDLPADLGPDRPEVIAVFDVTVGFEQVADRQVRRGFAIGHGTTLQP